MNQMGLRRVGLVLALLAASAGRVAAEPAVQWLSESFPPFSFAGPDGPTGIAVDLMAASLAQAGLPEANPVVMPWARVLQILARPEPACVTAMTRTTAREPNYQWVGPFLPADLAVGRRQPAPPWPGGAQPLAGRQVVVIRGDVSEEAARSLGVDEAHMHRVSSPTIAARMMLAGRVDGWVYGEAVMRWTLASMNVAPQEYRIDGKIQAGDNYFACSRGVDGDYLKRLQQGLDAVKLAPRHGVSEYERILARYLRSAQLQSP